VKLRPVELIPLYSIEDMIAGLRPEDAPETVDWGPDVGSEILPEDEYSRGVITPENIHEKNAARGR
jgi:antitoxin MazE